MSNESELARLRKEALATFEVLSREDSPIHRLSEARRANDADAYDPDKTLEAFAKGLDRGVERFGAVVDRFADGKPKK